MRHTREARHSLVRGLITGLIAVAPLLHPGDLEAVQSHKDESHPHRLVGRDPGVCRLLTSNPTAAQVASGGGGEGFPSSPHLRIYDRPGKNELVFEVGPIDLAVPEDPGAAVIWQFPPQLGTIPFDLTMHGYGVEVVDGDGKKLPQRQILHHIDTTRPAFRELFLPVAQRFIAAGGETDQKALRMPTWLGGLRLYRGEPFLVSAMLWNLTGAPQRGVRARLIMFYSHKKPLYDLYPLHLNVMFPVGVKSFDLPPGRSERSWEGSPVIRGGIVALGGHLHTYAEWIELFDVTANKRIWRIKPRKDESGEVTGVPVRQYRSGAAYPIFPNHRYRVKSVYVNPTDHTIVEGGMAVVGGAFIPKRGVAWPHARADDPLYHKDLEFMLRNHPCHVPAGEAAAAPDGAN